MHQDDLSLNKSRRRDLRIDLGASCQEYLTHTTIAWLQNIPDLVTIDHCLITTSSLPDQIVDRNFNESPTIRQPPRLLPFHRCSQFEDVEPFPPWLQIDITDYLHRSIALTIKPSRSSSLQSLHIANLTLWFYYNGTLILIPIWHRIEINLGFYGRKLKMK